MAIIATGSRHDMSYVAESTYGTTPATPHSRPLDTQAQLWRWPKTQSNLRNCAKIARSSSSGTANHQIGGDINYELSLRNIWWFFCSRTWRNMANQMYRVLVRYPLVVGNHCRSFTIERYFEDITQYLRYTGVESKWAFQYVNFAKRDGYMQF